MRVLALEWRLGSSDPHKNSLIWDVLKKKFVSKKICLIVKIAMTEVKRGRQKGVGKGKR